MKLQKIGVALVASAAITLSGASMASAAPAPAAGHIHKSGYDVKEISASLMEMSNFAKANVSPNDWRHVKGKPTATPILDADGAKTGKAVVALDLTGFNKRDTKADLVAMGERLGISDSLVCTPAVAPKAKIVKGKKVKPPRVFLKETCSISAPQGEVSPNFSFSAKVQILNNRTSLGSMRMVNDPRLVVAPPLV